MTIKNSRENTGRGNREARQELGAGAVVMNVKKSNQRGFLFLRALPLKSLQRSRKRAVLNAVQMAAMQQKKIENINLAADEKISIPLPAEKLLSQRLPISVR